MSEKIEYSLILASPTWQGTSVKHNNFYLRSGDKCVSAYEGYYYVVNFEKGLLILDMNNKAKKLPKDWGKQLDHFILEATTSRMINEQRWAVLSIRDAENPYKEADKLIEEVGSLPVEFHWTQWPLKLEKVVGHQDPFEEYYLAMRTNMKALAEDDST